MIQLKNLTKVYETVNYNIIALSDINYKFEKGEVVTLLGRSGSGKSTLLNILGGFDRDYAGHYILDNESMKEKSEREIDSIRKRRIGFVFQQYVLLNNLSVIENVELALRVIGVVNSGSRRRAALHALKLVGLRDHVDKYPYELSGGQRQRVAIARAFVKNPDIIIADEPTAALDSRTSKEILDLLKDLCRTKLLIIATHNKAIVRDYGSRIIELKSGYTVRNELITDKSMIEVDELDLIIDSQITEDSDKIQKIIDIEKKVTEDNKETVLKSLGVDLKEFRLNNDNQFDVDEELKKRLIKQRMNNSTLKTRIHRFLQTTDHFYGKREYANKSFFRNISLHIFSSLIFTIFLITVVFGFNFVTETFGGFNEKALYTRTMTNENVILYTEQNYIPFESELNMYKNRNLAFISDFPQTDIETARFFDDLFRDPYFRYEYEQARILYIYNKLQQENNEEVINIYYNNQNIMRRSLNEDIVFSDLGYIYKNVYANPTPQTKIVSFMDASLNESKIYMFDFIYSNNNEDILNAHLLPGSSLPKESNEVVIPVGYLFDYEIFTTTDFKDEHGNYLEVIPSEMIAKAFNDLPEEDKTLEITRIVKTYEDGSLGVNESTTYETNSFTIVGLVNFEGDINPYVQRKDNVLIANDSGRYFSLIFNTSASDKINYKIIDNATEEDYSRSIAYAEISEENYNKYNIEGILQEFDEVYLGTIKENIADEFMIWITALNDSSNEVSTYIEADLNGLNPSGAFLLEEVNSTIFPGLTKQDLLDYYIAQHLFVINDEDEYDYICLQCSFGSKEFYEILDESRGSYERIKNSPEYRDMLVNYGDSSRLTYQESTNRIIYEFYGHVFNNQFNAGYFEADYSLEVSSGFERENRGILLLVNAVLPSSLISFIPFFSNFQESLVNLETSESFIRFMENTNIDLLISSVSTNAVRSIILVVLYVVIYAVLITSIIFLSVVLINLYGNIYESATRKRIRELASLRVLGTSYEDIKEMIGIENRRVALFSYGAFFILLQLFSRFSLMASGDIDHFYMPLLGIFFDFNIYNVFVINYVVVGFVSLIFYLLIYRFIIRRVSTKKLMNIDTIQAIRDGDNL